MVRSLIVQCCSTFRRSDRTRCPDRASTSGSGTSRLRQPSIGSPSHRHRRSARMSRHRCDLVRGVTNHGLHGVVVAAIVIDRVVAPTGTAGTTSIARMTTPTAETIGRIVRRMAETIRAPPSMHAQEPTIDRDWSSNHAARTAHADMVGNRSSPVDVVSWQADGCFVPMLCQIRDSRPDDGGNRVSQRGQVARRAQAGGQWCPRQASPGAHRSPARPYGRGCPVLARWRRASRPRRAPGGCMPRAR